MRQSARERHWVAVASAAPSDGLVRKRPVQAREAGLAHSFRSPRGGPRLTTLVSSHITRLGYFRYFPPTRSDIW